MRPDRCLPFLLPGRLVRGCLPRPPACTPLAQHGAECLSDVPRSRQSVVQQEEAMNITQVTDVTDLLTVACSSPHVPYVPCCAVLPRCATGAQIRVQDGPDDWGWGVAITALKRPTPAISNTPGAGPAPGTAGRGPCVCCLVHRGHAAAVRPSQAQGGEGGEEGEGVAESKGPKLRPCGLEDPRSGDASGECWLPRHETSAPGWVPPSRWRVFIRWSLSPVVGRTVCSTASNALMRK